MPVPRQFLWLCEGSAPDADDGLASGAGSALITALSPSLARTHRIILIDANSFAFWPISSLRAAVQPGWEKRASAPLTKEAVFPADSQHEVLAGCKVVELREGSVVIDREFEGSTEVPFYVRSTVCLPLASRSSMLVSSD